MHCDFNMPSVKITLCYIYYGMLHFLRFWCENPGVHTEEQLAELRKITLARVLCDNGDNITRVQEDVFRVTPLGDWKQCNEIRQMDLTAWKDCCDCKWRKVQDFTWGNVNSLQPTQKWFIFG